MKLFSALRRKKNAPSAKTSEPHTVAVKDREGTSRSYALSGEVFFRPVATEKASALSNQHAYVFLVDAHTNKVELKKAIQATYKVSPLSVNIMNRSGKLVRYGKSVGRTKSVKKAIVTLRAGDTIHLSTGR